MKYDTGLGATGIPYSILNNSPDRAPPFHRLVTQTRADFGWAGGAWTADLFANYIGPYRNWSGTSVIPITQNAQGNPSGGGDPVKANSPSTCIWAISSKRRELGSDRISLTVINIADTDPPFYLGATGYDNWVASPLGRVIKLVSARRAVSAAPLKAARAIA